MHSITYLEQEQKYSTVHNLKIAVWQVLKVIQI